MYAWGPGTADPAAHVPNPPPSARTRGRSRSTQQFPPSVQPSPSYTTPAVTQTQGASVSSPFAPTPVQPTPAALQAEADGLLKRVQGCVSAGMTGADPFRANLERQLEDARARLVVSKPPQLRLLDAIKAEHKDQTTTTAS